MLGIESGWIQKAKNKGVNYNECATAVECCCLLLLGFEINDATMSPEGRTELRGGMKGTRWWFVDYSSDDASTPLALKKPLISLIVSLKNVLLFLADVVTLPEVVAESAVKEVVQKALVIPEKASSFNVHPERLCQDQCFYCGGKFGLYDTPCHIAAMKSSERQQNILASKFTSYIFLWNCYA